MVVGGSCCRYVSPQHCFSPDSEVSKNSWKDLKEMSWKKQKKKIRGSKSLETGVHLSAEKHTLIVQPVHL